MNKIVKCPTCNKEVEWSSEQAFRPFCSERCKLIDLGEWANESHRIAGEKSFVEDEINNDNNYNS